MTSSGVFQFGSLDKSNDGDEEKTDVFKEFKGLLPNLTIGYDEVPLDADSAWLLFLLLLSTIWLTYSLYYNSRVFGYILTKFVNNFIIARYLYPNTKRCEQPYFRVSSFSLTFISGKIMFRDLVWVTTDYSLRIQDGWIILRWWIPFEPRDIRKNDFSHSDARLSMLFNGFELHIYNRSQMYTLLERLFGISPPKFHPDYDKGGGGIGVGGGGVGKSPPEPGGNQSSTNSSSSTTAQPQMKATDNDKLISFYLWRNFFPLTKIEILTGRFVFGNHLIPSTLLITFEEGHITYTSRPAVSPHDLFTHIAKAKAESFKIILAPSPKYIGLVEEPPRFMGEGFVVFQTNAVDLYYYQDEPGLAASDPEPIELSSGDVIHDFSAPAWGLDIKCGKGTHFGYGPWADRNRDHLYHFFYPPDYQPIVPTPKPKPGEMRTAENFYIRLSTLADAAIDILFITKEKETKALHVNAGPGSYLEISIPWICKEEGYQSHIWGQILHLDATTNLNFRSLAESETLEFDFKILYPRIWNHHQTWICSLTGCKATVDLIFAHKIFFCDLIDDWAGKDRPDIVHFIPYTWKFSVKLIDFELITLANEYNWIDCSSKLNSENAQVAIVGDIYDMSFDLPFDEFLPPIVSIKIWIQGESLNAALYLPECNPHRETLHMLDKYAKLCPPLFNSSNQEPYFTAIKTSDLFSCDKKWSRSVSRANGWIDCWSVRIVALSIVYTYHPVPPKTHSPKPSEITTPEREELLLEPIRPESNSSSSKAAKAIPPDFNPGSMDPDLVELELEVGPSKICLYGTLFRMLWNIKENYIGEYQTFTDFNSNPSVTEPYELNKNPSKQSSIYGDINKPFDARLYRPLAVNVSVTLHNIQGHIMKSCDSENDSKSNIPPCPYLYLERLSFEMDKQYSETKMQLLLSPLILDAPEYTMALGNRTLSNTGHLILDSLQFRGHAMFSGLERPLDSETLEYAWLIEVHLGEISGRLSLPQFQQIFTGLETLLLQIIQEDCSLQPPTPYQKCLHDMVQSLCPKTQTSGDNKMCPYSEDLKYRMVRIDLDSIALYFIDVNTVLAVELDQIKFCTCNLHSCHTSSGMTALFKEITLHHYISMSSSLSNFKSSKLYLASTGNQSSQQLNLNDQSDATFYEVCKINFGPIFVDSAELLTVVDNFTINQDTFLKTHDEATKRLWFLWLNISKISSSASDEPKIGKCGCVGGCSFFGKNSRGQDFFSLTKHDPTLHSEGNILWGESLLRPGEPVVGFQLNTVFLLDEENEDTCELAPLFDRTNYCVTSPISPSVRSNSVVTGNDYSLQNISSFLSTSQTIKSARMGIFSRQLSSPCRSSPFPYRGNRSICNLTTSLSVSSAVNDERQKLPLPDRLRNRSLSETDDIEVSKDLFKQNGNSTTLDGEVTDKKVTDFNTSHSREDSSKSGASKATETYYTLTDPYFSASDSFSSSSKESKSTTADRTLVTAPTHQPIEIVKSDDTLVSIMSIPGSGPTCSGGVTFREQCGSMSQNALNKSRTSLQSTYSAPPDGPTVENVQDDVGGDVLDGEESEGDNRSISSSSFISAVSSQEEIGINALVDLRNQMEKSIIESPLLMSSYTNHLTRFKCSNHKHSHSSYDILTLRGRKKVIPRFVRATSNGLSCIRLTEKSNFGEGTSGQKQSDSEESKRNSETKSFNFTPGLVYERIDINTKHANTKKQRSGISENDDEEDEDLENIAFKNRMEKQFSKTVEYRSENLTILVRLCGEASIRISPLSVDGLKTFVDGITDSLAAVHPLTVLNHLNVKCFTSVSRKNQLKKEKTLEYGQLKHKAWKSTLDRENNNNLSSSMNQPTTSGPTSGRTRFGDAFQDVKSQFKTAPVESTVTANQYEENKRSKFQAFVEISKINIIVLQASLVEEFITFSALDDIRDLTCVSMFSISMSKTDFDFYSSRQERRSLHTIISNNIRTQPTSAFAQFAQSDIVSRLLFRKPKKEQAEVEPVTIETHELLEEETVGSSGIGSVHVQLTRLKNSSSILKEAILTVIPQNKSRVNFYYDKIPDAGLQPTGPNKNIPSSGTSGTSTGQRRRSSGTVGRIFLRRQDEDLIKVTEVNGENVNTSTDAKGSGDTSSGGESDNPHYSGFIMFEGGLEQIDLKAVKKREVLDQSNIDANQDINNDPNASVNVNASNESQVHENIDNIKEDVTNSAPTSSSNAGAGGAENKKDRKTFKKERDKGASSFNGEIGVIWLNFAAPLKTPNTRKIDYTRLDWHLLSTATPSINAWLSVGDRFVVAVKKLNSLYEQRFSSVITYLMIAGLEVEGIHIPPQSKCYIRKYTPYSKSLQEDPSCQLMNVLRRYLNRHASLLEVEDNLKSDLLPPLQVLKRGVIAASRQWKNALYMPLLVEQNIRLTRGERDASSIYQSSIPLRLLFGATVAPQKPSQDVPGQMNIDPTPSDERVTETIDEQTKLLSSTPKVDKEPLPKSQAIEMKGVTNRTRVGEETLREQRGFSSRRDRTSSQPEIIITNGVRGGQNEENGVPPPRRKMSTLPNIFSRSSRGSVAFPLLTYPLESLGSGVNKAYGFLFSPNSHQSSCVKGNKRQESQCSLKSSSSSSSAPDAAMMGESLFNPKSGDNSDYHEENLYLWMSRQQDYIEAKHLYQTSGTNNNTNNNHQTHHRRTSSLNPRIIELDPSRYATLGSAYSYEEENAAAAATAASAGDGGNVTDPVVEVPPGFVFVPTGVQLNNVRIIFQPLFSSLGVENFTEEGEAAISFDQLGPKITLSASIKMFKVNIVESEVSEVNRSRSSPLSFNSSNADRLATVKTTSTSSHVRPDFLFTKSTPPSSTHPQFNHHQPLKLETSAFVCDGLVVGLDLRKVKDTMSSTGEPNVTFDASAIPHHLSSSAPHATTATAEEKSNDENVPIVIVGPDGGINETTTTINFSVDVNQIIQRVNLPLLRLLHQVASMCESIKETREELKANRIEGTSSPNVKVSEFIVNSNGVGVDEIVDDGVEIEEINVVDTSRSPSQTSFQALASRSMKQRKNKSPEGSVNIDMVKETIIEIPTNDEDSVEIAMVGSVVDGLPSPGAVGADGLMPLITQPKCWRTMYYLLDLYETTPETKTIIERAERPPTTMQQIETKITIEEEDTNRNRGKGGYEQLKDNFSDADDLSTPTTGARKVSIPEGGGIGVGPGTGAQRKSMINIVSSDKLKTYTQALIHRELTPWIVFGVVTIKKVNLMAMLGGLKLDGDLSSFQVSLTHKVKSRGAAAQFKKWEESSLTGQLGQSTFSLFEEVPPNQQMVVKMTIGKSQTLISSQNRKGKDSNSALLTIGPIMIDIPQHPVALHGMMTRSSRQLSTTLQELRSSRQPSRSSRQQNESENITTSTTGYNLGPSFSSNLMTSPIKDTATREVKENVPINITVEPIGTVKPEAPKLIKPIVFQFSIVFDSFTIGASLLPSLRAQYKIGQITSNGIMGTKAKFVVDIREHTLSFNTNLPDSNLPSSANVSMPPIHVTAEYMEDHPSRSKVTGSNRPESFADGIVLRKGSYLHAIADIGSFEHSLTTDLLNHLLLVQKVFMKEVNEVVQKMSGHESKILEPELGEMDKSLNDSLHSGLLTSAGSSKGRYLLFSLHLRLKGIQITATTPTNSAVRLETGVMELQLSNRVQNMSSTFSGSHEVNLKLFIKLQVDLNVALGQLIRNALFEEADPEFQQLAYFKTRIVLRNALQDDLVTTSVTSTEDKEALLITLHRPLLYIQPLALDKAVLVWLNYKNAYEYWNEQRANLNKEVLITTQQVLDKLPQLPQINPQNLGTLFIQLTIDDLGLCLPISYSNTFQTSGLINSKPYDAELKSALVITLESTRISACSSGSLVSKARFTGLCFRFADDFETSLDDWKPDHSDPTVMNLCVVSEGTYEVCSKTITHMVPNHPALSSSDAKWLLNVSWKMEGFDIHVDTSIGKQFSALFKTLTAIAGDEDELDTIDYSSIDDTANEAYDLKDDGGIDGACVGGGVDGKSEATSPLINDPELANVNLRRTSMFKDTSMDTRKRSRLIEKELNEQAKIINDLKILGASQSTIEQEIKRLHELESAVFNDFKRDVIKKLRRQSVKRASFRDKMSLTDSKMTPSITETCLNSDIEPGLSPSESDGTKSIEKSNLIGGNINNGEVAPRSISLELSTVDTINEDPLFTSSLEDKVNFTSQSNSPKTQSLGATPTQESSKSTSLSASSRSHSSQQTSASISSDHLNTFSDSLNNTFSTNTTTSGSSKIDFTGSSVTTTTTSSNLSSPTNTKYDINASCINQNDSSDKSTDILSPLKRFNEKSQSTGIKETSFASEVRTIPIPFNQSKPSNHPIQEPYIDFELDIKVFFNSGKCVFHTRETTAKEEDYPRKNGLPKERSFIGNPEGLSSPLGHIPRQSALRSSLTNNKPLNSTSVLKGNLSSNRLRYPTSSGANTSQMDYSVFLIPGLDIKVHYNSKTVFGSSMSGAPLPTHQQPQHQPGPQPFGPSNIRVAPESRDAETIISNSNSLPSNTAKRGGSKKASCYAWMTLHSIPEETIISPHILDFMEQALEPIPFPPPSSSGKTSSPASDDHQLASDARPDLITSAPAQYAVYGSFPVDVIVYLHMQPSVLRFSCLPVSRVECLLQLPSVDLVFSSKRLQDELDMNSPQQPIGKSFPYPSGGPSTSRPGNFKYGHKRSASDHRHPQHQADASNGGLSMTGCLADFSLYIFHPYGGQKKAPGSTLINETTSSPHPKSNSDRKDALSLQVEFVKINISRSRRLIQILETSPPSGNRSSSQDKPSHKVMIRFSALCDIGSASFKYDMRRLTETLAFPKAWYRKAIWKRMFLGDQGISGHSIFSDQDFSSSSSSTSSSSTNINEAGLPSSTIKTSGHFNKSPGNRARDSLWLNIQDTDRPHLHHRSSSRRMKHSHLYSSVSSEGTNQQQRQIMNAPWKTLILFGVNLCKLNVHMNMANVMGNTSWLTRGFRSEGRVSIDSNGHKSVNVSLGLDGSSLDAKGGIIGGIFEISQIQTKVAIKENYGKEPDHMITLKLDALEKRLDYMGTSILMLRMSDLDLTLRDEWRIDAGAGSGSNHPTKRPACIFIHCNLAWDQLQLLMSKSTTPDIMKIIAKLEEFFSQQFHNSKRVFSSSGISSSANRHSFKKDKSTRVGNTGGSSGPGMAKPSTPTSTHSSSGLIDLGSPSNEIYRHHRHWQKVLRLVSGASLSTLCNPLPLRGTILGGTFELIGNNISLACFYGINFRSKSWGLFSMQKPSISFASEAQDVVNIENGLSDTHIIQNFTFSLGRRDRRRDVGDESTFPVDCFQAQHSNMATVCKISRTVMFPPQFKSLHEWFQYTFAGSELDQVNRFPVIEFERSGDGFGSAASAASGEFHSRRISVNPKSAECHHSKEVIFALPSFQMDLKTEHLQGFKPPLAIDPKPKVDCTFVTDFDDHIFVAVDAEAYFFLHELITSYFKEKQYYSTRGPSGTQLIDKPDPMMDIKSNVTTVNNKEATVPAETSTGSSSTQVISERDFREFNCQTWHLEPTVRLITWAGKNIEPYGVDYILQRLGFAQARTTIPKWIQRGAMDPLDKVLSAIMLRVISASKNESLPSSR